MYWLRWMICKVRGHDDYVYIDGAWISICRRCGRREEAPLLTDYPDYR